MRGFVKLREQWVNVDRIEYMVDFETSCTVRYSSGQEFVYHGDDVRLLREAMTGPTDAETGATVLRGLEMVERRGG